MTKKFKDANHAKSKVRKAAVQAGYRSGFEQNVFDEMTKAKIKFKFEPVESKLNWSQKSNMRVIECGDCCSKNIIEKRVYTPDFVLGDSKKAEIILETKGRFLAKDRAKMKALKRIYPEKLIVILFQNPDGKATKKYKYSEWCDSEGVTYLSYKDKNWLDKFKNIIIEWNNNRKK